MTLFADVLICLRFFSRLPLPDTARERKLGAGGLAAAMPMAPVSGMILGLIAAAVLQVASTLGLPPFLAAGVALTALVALTGALHEDALADCADGFGGGHNRERKLAIMRDSAVGAFGASAIILSLLLRCGAIAAAVAIGRGVAALVIAAALSRAVCFIPLALLPPARPDGVGAGATGVDGRRLLVACLVGVALAVLFAGLADAGTGRAAAASLAAALVALAVTALARRQIGGQTGDVAGAAQQAAEIAVLLVFAAAPR